MGNRLLTIELAAEDESMCALVAKPISAPEVLGQYRWLEEGAVAAEVVFSILALEYFNFCTYSPRCGSLYAVLPVQSGDAPI